MPKRFFDTERYKKPFYRNLPTEYKLLWDFLYADCSHTGVWLVNFELVNFILGIEVNEDEALELFNKDKQRIMILEEGKWFIIPFIEFQQGSGPLNPRNNAQLPIITFLGNYGLDYTDILERVERGEYLGEVKKPKVVERKEVKKVKKIEKGEPKKKYAEFVSLTEKEYDTLVEKHEKDRVDLMIGILDNYKGASGKRYESDYRAILSWVVKRAYEDMPKKAVSKQKTDDFIKEAMRAKHGKN